MKMAGLSALPTRTFNDYGLRLWTLDGHEQHRQAKHGSEE
jgi:hypothetical protein